MLPSTPYTFPATPGFWEPVTSTINWCEEDYYFTRYSAEIVNTTTNLLFIYLGMKGILNCLRNAHDTVFLLSFIGYLIVGIGSLLFHCTLTYPMQLVDELAMIYTTCLSFYAIFSHGKSLKYRIQLGSFLTFLCGFITGYYHYIQDPRFHEAAYAILTVIVVARSFYIMESNLRPSWRNSGFVPIPPHIARAAAISLDARRKAEARDLIILKRMYVMAAMGLGTFLGGFLIWNLDNMFCPTVRGWRHAVGLPWGLFLEGHGWWHIFSGIGAYIYIVWGVILRCCLDGRQEEVEVVWPSIWTSVPSVELRRPPPVTDEKAMI